MGSLLTSANLHKLNKEYDKAIADATEALKIDPTRSDTASLLGGIYEQRGMPDSAAVWYSTALELNPLSEADKVALDRVSRRVAAADAKKGAGMLDALREHTWIAAGAATVLGLILILLISMLAGRSGVKPESQRPMLDSKRYKIEIPHSAPSRSMAAPRSPASFPAPISSLAGGNAGGMRTSAESVIKSALSSSDAMRSAGVSIDDVIADPRQGLATVTFSISSRSVITKTAIIAAAASVSRAAFAAQADVKYVTARCVSGARSGGGVQVVFVGDAARANSDALGPNPTNDQLAALFTNPWWNPLINSR